MKIRQIKKTLSASGLLLIITLACVAVSLAQDSSPIGLGHSLGLQQSHAEKAATPLEAYVLRSGLVPQLESVPTFPRSARAPHIVQAPEARGRLLDLVGIKPRKVPRHLLDSVLLI